MVKTVVVSELEWKHLSDGLIKRQRMLNVMMMTVDFMHHNHTINEYFTSVFCLRLLKCNWTFINKFQTIYISLQSHPILIDFLFVIIIDIWSIFGTQPHSSWHHKAQRNVKKFKSEGSIHQSTFTRMSCSLFLSMYQTDHFQSYPNPVVAHYKSCPPLQQPFHPLAQ